MMRPSGRRACVVATLTLLIACVLSGAVRPSVGAEENPRAAAFQRVFQINGRRKLLEERLVLLKTQLATKRAAAAPLVQRLDTPELSLARAPQERGKLLDQASAALRSVVSLASKVVANMEEELALEQELVAVVANAQQDANASASDQTARGLAITRSKRQFVSTLRERAKAPSQTGADAHRARLGEVIDRFRAQGEDAASAIARFDAELRYATLSATPRQGENQAARPEPIATCKMRQIDWKNVTITVAGEQLTFRDGRGAFDPGRGSTERGGTVVLREVEFLDSNLDGREEALLLVERSPPANGSAQGKTDLLYVFESALGCSLRRRAEVTLSTRGGGTGKAVRGGYEYTEQDGKLVDLRWTRGTLVPVAPVQPIASEAELDASE